MSVDDDERGRVRQARDRQPRGTAGRIAAVGSLILVAAVASVIVFRAGSRSHPQISTPSTADGQSSRTATTSRTTAQRGTATVPILVYHVINSQPAGSSANPALYVPSDTFTSQMAALKANGWHAVTLDKLEANWTRGVSLGSGKPIVITFDNGYASQFTSALPVLKGLGWVGVLNLQVTGLPPSEGGLTDAQIRGLIAAGWELDTQGMSHADLPSLDPAQLNTEVVTARQTLHVRYGVPVNWLSYPSGAYNTTVIEAVRAAGYVGATTVNPGWAGPQQDRFRLPRLVVTGGTTASALLAQIAAAQSDTTVPAANTGPGLA